MASSKSPRLRLLHMRDEIDSLANELAGLNFAAYNESYSLRRTTERAIQIVSEAARALPEELRARYPEAPWADIIAIGNPLRHEYHRCGAVRFADQNMVEHWAILSTIPRTQRSKLTSITIAATASTPPSRLFSTSSRGETNGKV